MQLITFFGNVYSYFQFLYKRNYILHLMMYIYSWNKWQYSFDMALIMFNIWITICLSGIDEHYLIQIRALIHSFS